MKLRHGTIVDNIVTNVYAKFDDDRLRNEKALVLLIATRRITTFVALGDAFPGLIKTRSSAIDGRPCDAKACQG